ncbi:hypothetical protein DPMN_087944 [Dreissena polymorpha]|uniref:Fatty acid synthase n=2 Tax=Dreissena polymorpha TaxID=45954 RepID=A0A9D4KT82_DREPO|nr:hypothetical protein DPMN_087944 [Dreissena polymorpha]
MEKSKEPEDCLPNDTERKVQKIWQEILPIKRLPGLTEDFFFELSGDSLQAIHLVRKLRNAGFNLTVNDIFKKPTIKALCRSLSEINTERIKPKETYATYEPFRPTPIAERYMLTKKESDRFAVPALLEFRKPVKLEFIQKALQAVMVKHNSLSSRFFVENDHVFQQYVDVGDKPSVIEATLSKDFKRFVEDPIFQKTCDDLEHQLDIDKGNLLNAAVFRSDGINYCLIVIHHITVDIVSWQQLLEDLILALEQVNTGKLPLLSNASTPFHRYCAELWQEGNGCPKEEIDYWTAVTETYKHDNLFQQETKDSLYISAKWESQSIDAETVRHLSIAIGSTDESVILTAFGQSFANLEGTSLTVCLESHGRQIHLDSTDTVGWCTSMFPFTINAKAGDDFIVAARKVQDDIKQIPLHGLRYGPAVGVGKVESALPKTMFVFQGSLDASSKVEFQAGDASFKYLPWVEVLTHDLEHGHYHRDDNDILDFPLEVICWFHSDNLRIGSLFDSKKIPSEWVQRLLQTMKITILEESRKLNSTTAKCELSIEPVIHNQSAQTEVQAQKKDSTLKKSRSVQVLSNIMIDPETLSLMKAILAGQRLENTEIVLKDPSDFYHSLLQEKPAMYFLTFVLIRCTNSRQTDEIQEALKIFSKQNEGTDDRLVILSLENIPHSISLNVDKISSSEVLTVHFEKGECDINSGEDFNIPLTRQGYVRLALAMARTVTACLKPSDAKVICVDGDYTLWDGECANNDVRITEANLYFQSFLLQKMHEGFLLVLLSKNRQQDVLAILENKEMVLKQDHFVHLAINWEQKHENIRYVSKVLDLNLQSFVFIDDSVAECEHMLRVHPQVKTLRIPTEQSLVKAFTSSLWIFDKIDITSEATNRTDLYRSEVSRLAGNVLPRSNEEATNETFDLTSLFERWGMKMQIWKTCIRDLKTYPEVSKRVAELLYRTNQFKLNDSHVRLEDFRDDSECLVVSLKDEYGNYGIIAVIIFGKVASIETIKQWVMSCRALGRKIEERLLYEIIHNTIRSKKKVCLQFERTEKNIPMQNFLNQFTNYLEITTGALVLEEEMVCTTKRILNLHQVSITSDPSSLLLPKSQSNDGVGQSHRSVISANISILKDFSRWLRFQLSPEHMDHISKNSILPSFLLDENRVILEESCTNITNAAKTVEQLWMEILKTKETPSSLDNFVKQGGNSFQAVFLISEILAHFGIKVELIDILTKSYSWLNKHIQNRDLNKQTDKKAKLDSGEIELSQAQKRMWMLQSSSESSTAYTETIALQIETDKSLDEIVSHLTRKHPILLARIDASASCLHIVDSIASLSERKFKNFDDLMSYISLGKPVFDKAEEPLTKFMEMKCGAMKVFVMHVHHLLVDDITLQNIKISVRRLIKTPTLSSRKNIQQSVQLNSRDMLEDCVRKEKDYMRSAAFENDRAFWERRFAICPEETSFGLKPTEDIVEFVPQLAKVSAVSISSEAVGQIQHMCHEYGVTEFQYILACFLLVAQRYTAKEELLLAVPISNRISDSIEKDGLFVNTVLFRYKMPMEKTLREHIKSVAEEWMDSFSHSRYPVNYVGHAIWQKHGISISSVCNVMFNFATFEIEDDEVYVKPIHAKMPFSLDVVKDKTGLRLVCEYAEQLIQGYTVDNILRALVNVLGNGQANEELNLKDIEFLADDEVKTLGSFSASRVEAERSPHVFKMFSENAKSSPEATALSFKGTKTSYRELMDLVNAIAVRILQTIDAHELQQKPTLIYMSKTEKAIAAILAVWKIGGYFMPLSTMYVSNIRDVIESVRPCAVLVDENVDKNVDSMQNCNIINVNDVQIDSLIESDTLPTMQLDPDQPAYMIRTSGSTGTPKNIRISHKGLAIVASAWRCEYKMSQFHVSLLQWAPMSFDVFIGDIVRGLCCTAGNVVVCPDSMRLDTEYIISLIVQEKISIAEVTPQFGIMLTQRAKNKELDSLKIFILGSDILQKEVYNKVKGKLSPHQRLLNSYGMTEAAIDSSFFEGNTIPQTRGGVIPIGKPLPGVVLKVLDPITLRPCPVGVVGELYIGGDVVGSGEVNILEMGNEERFLKTGDSACWLYSGDVELCGRKDTMRKLRGFRIDSSHIENTIIRNCANVTDATVAVLTDRKYGQEHDYLCAFIVKASKTEEEAEQKRFVKDKVREILPYYMVPDFVEFVDKIPLSQNGKVDRKRLPTIQELLLNRTINSKPKEVTYQNRNDLKALFAESLGVESELIDDDLTFMEQGGHSLILMKFCSLINERTNLEIGIVEIFSFPSITLLSERTMTTHQKVSIKPLLNQTESCHKTKDDTCDIAICGVGLRLPNGTCSITEFWDLIENKKHLLSSFPSQRKSDVLDCSDPVLSNTLREAEEFKGAFLADIDKFDNEAFSISSTESQSMAPEQRIFLEVASETLAQGTDISKINGSNIGVFLSQTEIGYARLNHNGEATAISGLMPGMIATRVAYHYNLKGPTMLVDTACSSGISALKAACSSIETGECDAALVGGMNIVLYPSRTGVHGDNGILSPDFVCRPFDKNANGTSVGEGVICFYVEPLQRALEQNKHIYGVIKSICTNSVGKGNGITAPTALSQEAVIRSALDKASISPNDVSFIEAHGTGTVLGDSIELTALSTVFSKHELKSKVPIGSVKGNLGHLDYAAGFASLLKIIAGFMFKTIPPSVNFKDPHKELLDSALYVPSKPELWRESKSLRYAGLSAFGLTGTNTHMILSDVIQIDANPMPTTAVPLLLCGATHEHVTAQAIAYKKLIQQTVVKHKINTIQGITTSIAVKLNQIQKNRSLHIEHRVVILETDPEKLLQILNLVSKCDDGSKVRQLEHHYFILSSCPNLPWDGVNTKNDVDAGVDAFLTSSVVNISALVDNSKFNPLFCAPGVVLSIFNSKRHWIRPCLNRPRSHLGLIDILNEKVSKTQELVRTLNLTPTEDLLEYEAKFCCSIIMNLLKETELKEVIENQKEITLEESFSKTGMLAKYDKLFFIMIRELFNFNLVKSNGTDSGRLNLDVYSFRCRDIHLPSPKKIAEEALAKHPQWADCFKFPLHCSQHLKQVLWGHLSPLSVIYPQGDLNFMYQFDKLGDLLGDVYYNMYMQIIVEYAARLSAKGKTVRILEVGAGMGHVTRQLLLSLFELPNIEYWFTDLGRAFVENAKTLFEKYTSMMRFSTFDITKNAVKQGILGSYDIVISYNVIHTTESVYQSVKNLKTCLGEDGALFIIESAKNETWATLAWGILDGWWYFKDYDLRPYEPMLEPEKWEEVLKKSGFRSVHSCPMDAEERKHVEKFLFVCTNKPKHAEFIPAPTDGWWKSIDLTARRHADFDTDFSGSDESGLGDDVKLSKSAVKTELKRIWCELLDMNHINDEEDFNALGGESLLAIQMITMVRKRIGFQLEIADTFCYTSLGSLGEYISDQLEPEASERSNNESSTSSSESEMPTKTAFQTHEQQADKVGLKCLLMFPGQGSQKVGMCRSMKDSEPAKRIFSIAEGILGYNILDICTGPEDILKERLLSTEFVQVALFVSCLAKISQLQFEHSEVTRAVTHVAGLSVGEFAALVYAKVLRFEDALVLVQRRGMAMEKEVLKASTAMASVLGPPKGALELFLKEYVPAAVISTCLADNQHTVAGTQADVERLIRLMSSAENDLSVIDVRRLQVAGAFHSSYMSDAENEIKHLIDECEFRKPEVPIIMNVTGQLCDDPREIKILISRQIVETVQWKDSMITAYEEGVRRFIEVAPARVLSSIVRARIGKCKGCSSELINI